MHQVSLETICPLKAFQLHYCPDNNAKSMVKHFIFLQKYSVLNIHHIAPEKWLILAGAKISKSFLLKSDSRFRFLVKNYVRYYIFFFQNCVFKLKKCNKPKKKPCFFKNPNFLEVFCIFSA